MKTNILIFLLFSGIHLAFAENSTSQTLPAASEAPKGEVTQHAFKDSKIFPGTVRGYTLYVPRQYDPARPACVYICQDGVTCNEPAVFDQLIHERAMPVTVGVFIGSGTVPPIQKDALERGNRSYEYDGLGDAYVRFLLDELLPQIVKEQKLNLSTDPNDRCIAGGSSGGICAFTAAWERPDAFRRVVSWVGSFTAFRGGSAYSSLIRKFEAKPIRVFLQDGSNDLNIFGGDWWLANQEMEHALAFAGYEVNHTWGTDGHSAAHAASIFPDAMRWIWKDWPAPVKAGAGNNHLQEMLLPDEQWQLVAEGFQSAQGITANSKGEVFFSDAPQSRIWKIGLDSEASALPKDSHCALGIACGPDDRLYMVSQEDKKIHACDATGHSKVFAKGVQGHGILMRTDGSMYVSAPSSAGAEESKVWFISPKGAKKVVDTGLKNPTGVAMTPDQAWLLVAEGGSHWVYSYQIQPDGSLACKQRYYHLNVPDSADDSGADGMCVDRDGRLYVATRMGIQIGGGEGRVHSIIPTPNGNVSGLCFGGEKFDTLFALCGDKVFKRKLKVTGIRPFEPPFTPIRLGL